MYLLEFTSLKRGIGSWLMGTKIKIAPMGLGFFWTKASKFITKLSSGHATISSKQLFFPQRPRHQTIKARAKRFIALSKIYLN
jgi:hypothetical protein